MQARPGWPEYLMEGALLGVFMFAACVGTALLENPGSPLRRMLPGLLADPFARRCWMGAGMWLTAVGIFYSPWARRSGAHINPAVTLTFWRLGRIGTADAIAYSLFQVAGGTLGVLAARLLVGEAIANPAVRYAVTVPGPDGAAVALAGEVAICFAMMTAVLVSSSFESLRGYGGFACATLLALFIAFESPLSGTSLNPARTIASAVVAGIWNDAWVYFVAPPVGMLVAAELWLHILGSRATGGIAEFAPN